ncbi:MAG: lipoprotein, partial [Psychrobium sp.]
MKKILSTLLITAAISGCATIASDNVAPSANT